ncbi:MAG: hypothetical protein KDG89_03670 [Geminicoccaceae bacterium]|nr:hypothetical protein [Geminicoccaceae bacterium]
MRRTPRRTTDRGRPARRDGARARAARKNRLGGILIGVFVVFLAGGLGLLGYAWATAPDLDTATGCPRSGPSSVTAVLVDATDGMSPVQALAVRKRLRELRDAVPTGGAFEVYRVGPAALEPLAAACNPGRAAEGSVWTQNRRLLGERFEAAFEAPIEAALAGLEGGAPADSSPILESLKSVAVSAFEGTGRSDRPHRLVVVSDMLQHTSGWSNYREPLDAARLLKSDDYRRTAPDLRGAEVEILYLARRTAKPIQGRAHVAFWRDVLVAAGVQDLRFKQL